MTTSISTFPPSAPPTGAAPAQSPSLFDVVVHFWNTNSKIRKMLWDQMIMIRPSGESSLPSLNSISSSKLLDSSLIWSSQVFSAAEPWKIRQNRHWNHCTRSWRKAHFKDPDSDRDTAVLCRLAIHKVYLGTDLGYFATMENIGTCSCWWSSGRTRRSRWCWKGSSI